jgi:GcrA cell cycle regulator
MTWSDARVETLTNLWGDGLSASLIAARLGGTTRNAVIGKVRRLGLQGRATLVTRRPPRAPLLPASKSQPGTGKRSPGLARSRRPETKPRRPTAPPELGAAPEIPVTVLTLMPANCNWPEGDPKRADFHFCGRDKPPDRAYCPHHAARAYR